MWRTAFALLDAVCCCLSTHLGLQLLLAVLAAAVMVPHPATLLGAHALLLAAVLVVAALAAVTHQEVTRPALAAAAASPWQGQEPCLLAWALVQRPLANLAVDPAWGGCPDMQTAVPELLLGVSCLWAAHPG